MINHYFIRQLRKKNGLSQEDLAVKLGISRPTYLLIEKGDKELTVSQAQELAGVYSLSLDELLAGQETKREVKVLGQGKKTKRNEMEIRVEKKNLDKFKQVLLYVLEKVGAKPNVGETVIYKLLYFIDFDYFEKYEENLMGATYIKNHHGPTPVEFKDIVELMEAKGEIVKIKSKYFQYEQKKYLPNRKPDLTKLDAREISHIDNVLEKLSDKSAADISAYSHGDIPWQSTAEGKKIEYESVFYRDDKYSVKEYGDEL
jgi:transcriptional regulator with XRE-family HTH domain